MIRTIRHRGLKKLFLRDDESGVSADHLTKIRHVLTALNDALTLDDMNMPGLQLHALRGDLKGLWSVRVSANFRIVFRMENGDVYDVDLVDYH